VVDLCFEYHSSTSCREVEYFDDRVRLSVSIYVEVHVQSSPNFWSMLLLTVAQSSSGGVYTLCTSSFMDDIIFA